MESNYASERATTLPAPLPFAGPLHPPEALASYLRRDAPSLHVVLRADSVKAIRDEVDAVEMVTLGGFINFLGIYNALITGRILLSWFPQAQGQPLLQPLFVVTDPFLNLFRGLIPPIGGLDLSILPALLILSSLGNAIPALGADLGLL